jgi:hypothetical protein
MRHRERESSASLAASDEAGPVVESTKPIVASNDFVPWRIQPVRSRNRNVRFRLDLTRSRRHPRTPASCTLGSCTASSSLGSNPSSGHRRKHAIGFDPTQRLCWLIPRHYYWHSWHSWRSANSAKKLLLWQSYTLRNVVCLRAPQGRSGPPPALLETTKGRGAKRSPPSHC